MNFENWEYHTSKRDLGGKSEISYLNSLEQKFEAEIRGNMAKYADFFAPYLPETVDGFIAYYAKHKRSLVEMYEYYIRRNEEVKELRFRDITERTFLTILHKKLLNVHLLWQAEKLVIPEIRMKWDFSFWEETDHLKQCPFLEAVTQEEVELMKRFLRDNAYSFDLKQYLYSSYSVDYVTERDEDGEYEYMPEWYEYYDQHMGTGYLLDLPHLRSLKEDHYMDFAYAQLRKEEANAEMQPQARPKEPELKHLFSGNEEILAFVNRFEDDYFKILEKGNQRFYEEDAEGNSDKFGEFFNERVDEAIRLLFEAETPIIVEQGLDWRKGVVRAANAFLNNVVADELDMVFAEYSLLQSAGVGKGIPDISAAYAAHFTIPLWEIRLLDGRELAGEPRDFNF